MRCLCLVALVVALPSLAGCVGEVDDAPGEPASDAAAPGEGGRLADATPEGGPADAGATDGAGSDGTVVSVEDGGSAPPPDSGAAPSDGGGGGVDAGPSCPSPAGCEAIVSTRAEAIVAAHASSAYPGLGSCWGDVTWALAALWVGRDVAMANERLSSLTSRYSVSSDPTVEDDCYWTLPLVARVYLHPVTSVRLSAAARAELLGLMWTYVRRRSRVADGLGSVWEIHESENHDAMRKSNYLLFAQALEDAGRGGDLLADGNTVTNHLTAWQRWWKEYFRQRAREGIHVEIASPIYGRYTLQTHYNLHDYARSGVVRRLARDFLSLYWADVAQDFLPAVGVRGGGMTRVYKDHYTTRGASDGLRPMAWMYGWHEGSPGATNPSTLAPATSDWRPPPVVDAMATRRSAPHQYISRRFGQGTTRTDAEGFHYTITFPGGSSSLRRFTWWTPDYVLGTLTFDPAREYVALADQNRWMGVVFASHPNHRIVVHGLGEHGGGRTGYAEITGITGPDCAIVARDPSAERSSGTRIFVSYGDPWDNRVEEGGWLFTRAGAAYAAVRPATGGWVVHSVAHGKMLDLPDMWSPVVIQTGRASEYASFVDFRASVRANSFDWSSGRLRYTSEEGNVYEVWANSANLPRMDGRTPSLNPAKTYSSPYILGWHGDDTVRLAFPGMTALTLDFSY